MILSRSTRQVPRTFVEVMIAISYDVSAPLVEPFSVSLAWGVSALAFGIASLIIKFKIDGSTK